MCHIREYSFQHRLLICKVGNERAASDNRCHGKVGNNLPPMIKNQNVEPPFLGPTLPTASMGPSVLTYSPFKGTLQMGVSLLRSYHLVSYTRAFAHHHLGGLNDHAVTKI